MNEKKLLLARMSLNAEKLSGLEIIVLDFPFSQVVNNFCKGISKARGEKEWPPYRQLNNALIACIPTLTHGFEKLYFDHAKKITCYQALAVGTPNCPVSVPTPEDLFQLIQIWAHQWVEYVRKQGNWTFDK